MIVAVGAAIPIFLGLRDWLVPCPCAQASPLVRATARSAVA
ncbi:MAG TPA: hypothetical protein VN231_06670 [Allosphingosinicella sp.]|nr:hypothetical protein [Allosphingosinicella sp.]